MADDLKILGKSFLSRVIPKSLHSSLRLWLITGWPDRDPQAIESFDASSVTVLAPHPDDEVIGPGGTIRRHVQAGAKVTPIILTDGKFGGYDPDQTLVQRRQTESREAAKILGTLEPIFLNCPDCGLDDNSETSQKLVRIINEIKPAIVYLPALTDGHRDHWATNRVLAAALPLIDGGMRHGLIIRGYEVWSPLLANRFVDITMTADDKRRAIEAFPSQTGIDDYAGAAMGLNRYRALRGLHGRGFAEAFLEMTVAEFRKLYAAASLRRG